MCAVTQKSMYGSVRAEIRSPVMRACHKGDEMIQSMY